MSLTQISDNKILVENLMKTIKEGRLSHAIIIEGDEFCDKRGFAKAMVKALVCKEKPGEGCDLCIDCRKIEDDNYEDLLILDKDKETIKVEDVIEIQTFLKRKASLNHGNIVLISNGDNLTTQSQNKLLKTLEEPSGEGRIIILSQNTENFLDTVKSRSVIYRLNTSKIPENNETLKLAEEIIEKLQKEAYFHQVKKLMSKHLKDKEKIHSTLDAMEKVYRNYLFDPEGAGRLYRKEDIFNYIKYIEEAKKDMRYGVSPSTAFKDLLLKIGG